MTSTTITVANFCHRARGEKVRDLLRNALKSSFINPEIGLAPAGGSFDLFVTSGYVFAGEDGETDAEDQAGELRAFVLSCLAFELSGLL
jgi:hypothetical protein